MNRGINLGNVLSASIEGNWSGEATEQYFIDVSNAGFKNVRIPIDLIRATEIHQYIHLTQILALQDLVVILLLIQTI